MRIDDAAGVRLGPEDTSSLLLLLHGRGADEHDLALAETLRLPDRVAALRGPVPWPPDARPPRRSAARRNRRPGAQGGRAWAETTADVDGLDERVYPMLGHGVAEQELADVGAFLAGPPSP